MNHTNYTSESIRLDVSGPNGCEPQVGAYLQASVSAGTLQNLQKKVSSFQITSIRPSSRASNDGDGGEDSENDTEDTSDILDSSRLEQETPSFSEEYSKSEDVIAQGPCVPTNSQYGITTIVHPVGADMMMTARLPQGVTVNVTDAGLALSKADGGLDDIDNWQKRFKIVKISSNEKFKRGRWVCFDFHDSTDTSADPNKNSGDQISMSDQDNNQIVHSTLGNIVPSHLQGGNNINRVQSSDLGQKQQDVFAYGGLYPQLRNTMDPSSGIAQKTYQIGQRAGGQEMNTTQIDMSIGAQQFLVQRTTPVINQSNIPNQNIQVTSQAADINTSMASQHIVPPSGYTGHTTVSGNAGLVNPHISHLHPQQHPESVNQPGHMSPSIPITSHPITLPTIPSTGHAVSQSSTSQAMQSIGTNINQGYSYAGNTAPIMIPGQGSIQTSQAQVNPSGVPSAFPNMSTPVHSQSLQNLAVNTVSMSITSTHPTLVESGELSNKNESSGPATATPPLQEDGESLRGLVRALSGVSLSSMDEQAINTTQPVRQVQGPPVQGVRRISSSASSTSTVAIDNKIEQAMDLVKSHLMFAVREEVEVLKEKIGELMDKVATLEHENSVLRQYAPPEALQQPPAPTQSQTTHHPSS